VEYKKDHELKNHKFEELKIKYNKEIKKDKFLKRLF
jgi:hypothetical protein